ncbi:UDP-N-acetylmuramoyl-tripeptide--D-alanyl-D-alanine ligase [Candidatus Microgenomates bacterium]|nr:MAG: UDP-N-acetylmuramoyl-tripeptide--D-alanyl-D-alanine ligase [Candidatus Microgenomates bacterium]
MTNIQPLLLTSNQYLIGVLVALFIFRSIRNVLYLLYIWQLREYRLDRMRIHLFSDTGQRWMFGNMSLVKWVLLLATIVYRPLSDYVLVFIAVFALEDVLVIKEWLGGIKKPVLTAKIAGIILLTTAAGALFVRFVSLPLPFTLLLLDKLLPLLVSFLLLLFWLPAYLYKKIILYQAGKKIKNHPQLLVIGVTGSFGKSSTKEFLRKILSQKYVVVATPESRNTDIGIAKTILGDITSNTQIFIAEMGAYKRGEIKDICRLVRPSIGVITGINEQHVELFGTLANTRQAKYELIESLPRTGLAVFNDDNEFTRLMYKKTKHVAALTYGKKSGAHYKISEVVQTVDELRFTVSDKSNTLSLKAALLGTHFAYNITAAIAVARFLKIPLAEIQKSIAELAPLPRSMKKAGSILGAALIDDTFNANPDGVKAAINYLQAYQGKKYAVLTPLIELGKNAQNVHEDIARFASQYVDGLILTNPNFALLFKKEFSRQNKSEAFHVARGKQAVAILKKTITDHDAVVFLGKEANHVLKLLQSK